MFLAKNSQPHYFLNSCRHWNEWVCFHHQLTHSVNGTSIYLILKGPLSLSFFALCQSKRFWKLLAFIRAHRPNFGGCGGWKSDKAFSLEYLQRRKESKVFSSLFSRRIHITEETHKFLGGDYEVEEGHGGDRHPYLREHNIKSYLVIPPDNFHEVSRMFNGKLQLIHSCCAI